MSIEWIIVLSIVLVAMVAVLAMAVWALRREEEHKVRLEERMEQVFKNLSTEALDRSSEKLYESGDRMLQNLINPLKENIADFRKQAEHMYGQEGTERASLKGYIESIQSKTDSLAKALKGDGKVRGDWGEASLNRILETSGLRKGTDYEIQPSIKDENNANQRPDAVVYLPQKRVVVIDAKFSLVYWTRYIEAQDAEPSGTNEDNAKLMLTKHANTMQEQVKKLSQKNYEELTNKGHRLEMVLMFVPLEPAFLAAMEREPRLYEQALEKRVAIVSQTTLMAMLHLIDRLWKVDKQSRNVQEIAIQAAKIYDKAVGFQESMREIGKHLDTAKHHWSAGYSRLSEGRGNLLRQTERLREMGVSSKKRLEDTSANMGASDENLFKLSDKVLHEDSEHKDLGENRG